jgi:branched-chain amino acid transport system substrate-binding protein
MPFDQKSHDKNLLTRRDFLKKGGAAGAALGAASVLPTLTAKAFAARQDYILIGHPNPSTGALAEFGVVSPWTDERAIAAVNAQGGIYVQEYGKRLPVRVKVVDTQSDPVKAAKLGEQLILKDKVDMMVAMHTPDTVNPVSKVCERYEMPCVSMVVPLEAWLSDGPYKWCYHAFWSVDSLSNLFLGMWGEYADKTSKVFGGLWPNDPDGKAWADIFTKKLTANGYKVVDPGRFEFWTADFTEIIDLFKKENVQIIGGVIIPPDWTNFWRQSHQDEFFPKMAAISKAIPFPSAVNALEGNLAAGLISELWWSPYHPFISSLSGETSKKLSEAWSKDTEKQWTMPLGFAYAGFEIALNALQRAQSLDKAKIREALDKTDLKTLVGTIKFGKDHTCETPLVGGQWMKGKSWPWELGITYNKEHPEIPITAKMVFPLPH